MAFRLNLICHGMMLYLYDKQDHFTIVVPNPNMGGMPVHVISLTAIPGGTTAPQNLLRDLAGNYNLGAYSLQLGTAFTRANSGFCKQGQPNPHCDVVLYRTGLQGASQVVLNDQGFPDPSGPIWFKISVPYPSSVHSVRPETFSAAPYNPGQTVNYFNIEPTSLGGEHVFTYDGVPEGSTIRLANGTSVALSTNGDHLNLHLYSEPTVKPTESHLPMFNSMAYIIPDAGATFPLDLFVNDEVQTTESFQPLPPPLDTDLTLRDLESLAEISGATPKPMTELVDPMGLVDPVECLQGWGT